MRADVKLGVIFSAGIVLAAGGYYLWRSPGDAPIELSESQHATSSTPAAGAEQEHKPSRSPGTSPARTPKPRANNRTALTDGTTGKTTDAVRRDAIRPAQRTPAGTNTPRRPAADPNAANPGLARRNTPTQPATNPAVQRGPSSPETKLATQTDRGTKTPTANRTNTSAGSANELTKPAENVVADAKNRESAPATRLDQPGASRTADRIPADASAISPGSTRTQRQLTSLSPGPSSQKQAAVESHVVQPGDTLAGLARRYYGSERHTDFLIKSNPQIANPSLLRVGTTVLIPALPDGGAAASTAAATTQNAAASRSGTQRTYRVREGESFYAIARDQLGDASRWTELYELNKDRVGGDPTSLRIGQEIVLPAK